MPYAIVWSGLSDLVAERACVMAFALPPTIPPSGRESSRVWAVRAGPGTVGQRPVLVKLGCPSVSSVQVWGALASVALSISPSRECPRLRREPAYAC